MSEEIIQVAEVKERGKFSLRTNLLYWLGGLGNLGFEWNPRNTDLGFIVNGGYGPFNNEKWEHNLAGWFVAPEVRYYLGKDNHWFIGAQYLAGGFNIKLSDTGRQGNVNAGGLTGGYKMELTDRFDMDFSLGLGYGTLEYDAYYHYEDINIRKVEDIKKTSILPIQAGVSLIWKILK